LILDDGSFAPAKKIKDEDAQENNPMAAVLDELLGGQVREKKMAEIYGNYEYSFAQPDVFSMHSKKSHQSL